MYKREQMLNFVFYFSAVMSIAGAQQARKDICDAVNSLIIKDSVLKAVEMFEFADSVVTEVVKNKKLADIPFKNLAAEKIPKKKLLPFTNAKNDMDNCLKRKNRQEKSDEVFDDFGGIVLKISQDPYKRITKKRDDARKKKKTDDELRPIIYTASKPEFTNNTIQNVFNSAMKKFPCPVWQCFVESSKNVALLNQYKVSTENCKT